MNQISLSEFLENIPFYRHWIKDLQKGKSREITGLTSEWRVLTAIAAAKTNNSPVIFITADEKQGKKAYDLACEYLNHDKVGYFPPRELVPYDIALKSRTFTDSRIHLIEGLLTKKSFFAVVPGEAMCQKYLPLQVWQKNKLTYKPGDIVEITDLTERLLSLGYERAMLTEEPGSFSVRGSVIDVFPPTAKQPYRLDFFDNEIEAIRLVDPEKQVSVGNTDKAVITVGAEWILPADLTNGRAMLQAEGKASAKDLKGQQKKQCLDSIARWEHQLDEGLLRDGMEFLLPYFYKNLTPLEDFLPENGLIFFDDGNDIKETFHNNEKETFSLYSDWLADGMILPSYLKNFRSEKEIWASLAEKNCTVFSFLQTHMPLDIVDTKSFPLREFSFYHDKDNRGKELKDLQKQGKVIFCSSDEEKLRNMLDFGSVWDFTPDDTMICPLKKSTERSDEFALLVSEGDLLNIVKDKKPPRAKQGTPLSSFVDLKEGDYVVHDTHGIGRYMGIERIVVNDSAGDYLKINYSGKDKLFIPVEQLDMLQKYIGQGEVAPKLNKLGGKEWQRTKEKARISVQDMAKELLKLYSERAAKEGFAFPGDTQEQRAMEDDFPFEETDDQLRAISEIKKDMEAASPMDRLLCGDVGYGKTEVAVRAAFKAVFGGKQVAILVPTTILAQQHEYTFRNRLEKYGIRINSLSRFKSTKQASEILKELENGNLDIIIGTHRLFGKNVKFKDLGLLIIDEEQRFGVAHKEKIKQLKQNIDVLTMSATPIPRTLHMSMIGVRDISLIETPPVLRRPVQTYVMERQSRVIRESIRQEIARGGQVFFVHNRVESIYNIQKELEEILPNVRVLIAHGQMNEKELEDVMLRFMEKEADVLLATTILESGLDFPNVNTILVDNADCLGLAQMYQLRGRVGRSTKQAYAYFFYQRGKELTTVARKRLCAIRDYTDLGAGFKIALRDMEIRGVGNIFGAEQHGHMASVGFDMYCRLIDEEVHRLKGEKLPEPAQDINIKINISAYLPDDYIGDNDVKLGLYKQIAETKSRRAMKELVEELEDRFGAIPDSAYSLLKITRLKMSAKKLQITSICQQGDTFTLTFKSLDKTRGTALSQTMSEFGNRLTLRLGEATELTVNCRKMSTETGISYLIKILDDIIKKEMAILKQ